MEKFEFKGTKGEWKLTFYEDLRGLREVAVIESEGFADEKDGNGIHILHSYINEKESNRANMALIATAPELLEALIGLHNLLEEYQPLWYLRHHHNKTKKAIEKATKI